MLNSRIIRLQRKVRDLHYNPPINHHSESRISAQETLSQFWEVHILPVIEISKRLALKYGANLPIVWLASVIHDIARVYDLDPHDLRGAKIGYQLVLAEGFERSIARDTAATALPHSCKKWMPKTPEQKILATADALAHFQHPFYLWYHSISPEPFEKLLEWNLRKINHDFHEKIFFKEERESVRAEYEIMKKWCTK